MKIYIPSHLKKLEIINTMSELIKGYSNVYSDQEDSFDDYYYNQMLDSVKRFIIMCIPESSISPGNDYSNIISYQTHLFYSLKGTTRVFDYMSEYLGIKFKEEPVWSNNEIKFEIEDIETLDMTKYTTALKEFLGALLYYSDLELAISQVKLLISGGITNMISPGIIRYKKYEVVRVDKNYKNYENNNI